MNRKVLLMILDGWGEGEHNYSNAIWAQGTPVIDSLRGKKAGTQVDEEEKKMLHRVELLKETLAARQKVHLTLVTTFGLVNGKHSGKVQKVVTCDDLFAK